MLVSSIRDYEALFGSPQVDTNLNFNHHINIKIVEILGTEGNDSVRYH